MKCENCGSTMVINELGLHHCLNCGRIKPVLYHLLDDWGQYIEDMPKSNQKHIKADEIEK